MSADPGAPAPGDVGRRRARRRLAPDGLAGPERSPERAAADPERVLDAIATLGYRRNSAARALVTARSGTIGVVTTGSALYGPTSTLIAVEVAAREEGTSCRSRRSAATTPPQCTRSSSTSWPRGRGDRGDRAPDRRGGGRRLVPGPGADHPHRRP
ncbi:hypothetical protein NKG05_06575 [Oerskovia sp. M15]